MEKIDIEPTETGQKLNEILFSIDKIRIDIEDILKNDNNKNTTKK